MATPNLNSAERLRVYRLLYRINRSFHFIVLRLAEAETLNLLNQRDAHDMLGLAQEVQTEINWLLLDWVEDMEMGDLSTFGKVRLAMEKETSQLSSVVILHKTPAISGGFFNG